MELTKSQNLQLMTIANASIRPHGTLTQEGEWSGSANRNSFALSSSQSGSWTHSVPIDSSTRRCPPLSNKHPSHHIQDQSQHYPLNTKLYPPIQAMKNNPYYGNPEGSTKIPTSITQSFAQDIEKEIESMRNITNAIAQVAEVNSPLEAKGVSEQATRNTFQFEHETGLCYHFFFS